MSKNRLQTILEEVKKGTIDIGQALEQLKVLPYEDIEFARIDHHRQLRQGVAEVIFCQGKTLQQIVEISKRMLKS